MTNKYNIVITGRFKKDLHLVRKQGKEEAKLTAVVNTLASGASLPQIYKDHALTGEYKGCRECHIQPDWLLIYQIIENNLILYLMRTGSHSDLFQ